VSDPNKISSKQERAVKKYVKEFFDKAVVKHREHEKRKREKATRAAADARPLTTTLSKSPPDAPMADGADDEVQLSDADNDDNDDDNDVVSDDASPSNSERKRKREREDEDEAGHGNGYGHGRRLPDVDGAGLKRVKTLDDDLLPPTPPPPPPPPPPPAGSPGAEDDGGVDDCVVEDAEDEHGRVPDECVVLDGDGRPRLAALPATGEVVNGDGR
jgi:[histone H3]-lysine36 N-trimethyltransferase